MNPIKIKKINRMLSFILSLIIITALIPVDMMMAKEKENSSYGTVYTYTGGTITGNGTENISVLIEETTLEWVEAAADRSEGWWVGICANAPESATLEMLDNAKYKSYNGAVWTDEKNFKDYRDGDNYIGLWFPISAENLDKFAQQGRNLTTIYQFDWDNDSIFEQTIEFSVVPSDKIVLKKGEEQIYPVPTAAIEVNKNEGGKVTLNGSLGDVLTVEKGSSVEILVEADEGYLISSVVLGDKEYKGAKDTVKFTVNETITEDITVSIEFIKVYIVTIKSNENGTVDVTPAVDESGCVTVKSGEKIEIEAKPSEHYHVEQVIINGEKDPTITGANDSGYDKELEIKGKYDIEIMFALNSYTISTNESVNGAVEIEKKLVPYGESTKVSLIPDDGYMVDRVKVNETIIPNIIKDEKEIYFIIENISENQRIDITFKKIVNAFESDVIIDDKSALRINDDKTLYVIKLGSSIDFSTKKSGIRIYDKDKLIAGDETTESISVNDTTTITKIELYYQEDNEYYAQWHTVETAAKKVVVDEEKADVSLIPMTAPNKNGYYNDNVIFEVEVEDTGDYSGIKCIEYWVTYNNKEENVKELYSYTDGEEIKSVYSSSEDIIIDAALYNSQDVKVTLRVIDRAGNRTEVEKNLKINSTAPSIALDMEDEINNPDALDGYYKNARTLTITVTDRDDTFDAQAVANGMNIKANGSKIDVKESDIKWDNSQENIHIGTYEFQTDAQYNWSISYTNKAGKTNEGVTIPDDKHIYNFTIDSEIPKKLDISYTPDSFWSGVLENISFGFYKANLKVTIKADDDTSGIEEFVYFYTVQENVSTTNKGKSNISVKRGDKKFEQNGNAASTTFKIPAQFRGNVSFYAVDKAGNKIECMDEKVVVVDDIAPNITVEYDTDGQMYGSYCNASRKATIYIKEANFFGTQEWNAADLYDFISETNEYLVITVDKTLNDGTHSKEKIKPTFTKCDDKDDKEDTYFAEVEFSEDADYKFTIQYTDRSGNRFDSVDEFTIDTIKPIVKVDYSNENVLNGNYFSQKRTAVVTIEEHNFNADFVEATITANGKIMPDAIKWEHDGNNHTATITFNEDAHYTFDIQCVDLAKHENDGVDYGKSIAPTKFIVDKQGPENLNISYKPNFLETLIENITFGFYQAPVTVKIEANDITSGIDYFQYSYIVSEGASEINAGAKDIIISSIQYDGSKGYAEFPIPAQFRGNVSFSAVDKAGNSAFVSDSKVVVIDDTPPSISVSYDNNNVKNGSYYNADRKATIYIEEANFFGTQEWNAADFYDFIPGTNERYLVITVEKTLNNNEEPIKKEIQPTFTKCDDKEDTYFAEVEFSEDADYKFTIQYTDRSGNPSCFVDEFIIDKKRPQISITQANGAYFQTDREAIITIVEHNFRASDIDFNISAKDVTGDKKVDLSAKEYENYLKNQANWTPDKENKDTWISKLNFDIEGNYELEMTYSDLAGNPQEKIITDTFCIDKKEPQNLKITYEPSFIGTILENLTFGFYTEPLKVVIEATDEYAGIDYFTYSYTVQTNSSKTNVGKTNVIIDSSDSSFDIKGNKTSAFFEIPAQFRGFVSFKATDKSGNFNSIKDDKVVVVDNVAPDIHVVYDNNAAKYDKYYVADRTATITITEANFFEEDLKDEHLVITVGKMLDDGTYTEDKVKPTFKKNGDEYTANIHFTENADYSFDIKYTDRSGNVYDSYKKDEFTIDKTKPIINVAYDNNICNNGDQFKADREATIVITEHNFKASDIVANVTANGLNVERYKEYLTNDNNWIHSGNVHTTKIQYTDEAHYTFEIDYIDMAGNKNSTVNYGESIAPTKFTLDKTAPTDLKININDKSVLGIPNNIAFDTFYAQSVNIKLSATCDISGLESLQYQKVSAVSEYKINGTWLDYNENTGIVVTPNEKFIIYFKAQDRAGNVSIVNSTGIVVDNKAPAGEINAPNIDILPEVPNENGFYSGNVIVDLKVVDPKYIKDVENENGFYSGINNIFYRIYTTDTDIQETGVLFSVNDMTDGAVYDLDGLANTWNGKIIIDSSKFNSNNVFVEITATDNAGNTRTTLTKNGEIKIDITEPTIDIMYDNNDADSETFFKADRTATIVITERNFSPDDVKINITNTDSEIPNISGWEKAEGTNNLDNTTWTSTITYNTDGDYEFSIEYTDLADNSCISENYEDGTVAAKEFTIDKTIPVIDVSYDNNVAENGNYYKEIRTATIVITEHNFDEERVNITMTAENDGEIIDIPVLSNWTSDGDNHTATITYGNDGFYSFDIDMRDKAGNESVDFEMQNFYIDTTAPSLNISGIENFSANSGDIIPIISYSDTNYDDGQVQITLYGANRKNVELNGFYTDQHNGKIFTFNNFAREKSVDDIYTLTAALTDKAGNSTTETIIFSVNRFGSTYLLSDDTEKLNGSYVKNLEDIVITEINANELKNIKITLFKNNETIILKEGIDYKIDVVGSNEQWYQYTYVVLAKNFTDDGVYRVALHSEDKAGNIAENILDTKNMEIGFGVDSIFPVINIKNLESKTTYALDNMTVKMTVKDNLKLAKVIAELDNKNYKEWSGDELEEIINDGGDFVFDISGDSTDAHRLVVYAVDAAGNGERISESELPANAQVIEEFYVTTNLWVRYYTNKPLFFGSIAGVIFLAGFIVFIIVYKKKRNESKQ